MLPLTAEKFGFALAWFERGATAGKLSTNAQLYSTLKEKSQRSRRSSCSRRRSASRVRLRVGAVQRGMVKLDGQDRGNSDGPGTSGDQMFADEKAEKPRPPSEPPVPDAATKRLKTIGALTIRQAPRSLSARQARG